MKKIYYFVIFSSITILTSCSSSRNSTKFVQKDISIQSLKYINQFVIPYNFKYNKTTVGGLSSIDYDPAKDIYYMICDDRSDINPARFYTAKIDISEKGIDTVRFQSVHTILQPNGTAYTSYKIDKRNSTDPESMRYFPSKNQLVWSSEGDRIVSSKDTILQDPSIHIMSTKGKWKYSFTIPEIAKMHATEFGPRRNGVFEGLTFADNYRSLFVSIEEPLYQDGPSVGLQVNNSCLRLLQYDVVTKQNIAQYAYKPDPVAYAPNPANGFKVNGISEILAVSKNKFLIIERSYSVGRDPSTIKIFLADISNATNILNNPSLLNNPDFVPAEKKLLYNMDELGFHIDNVEGLTFGPTLPNGKKSILFIVDNNFSPVEPAQVFLFEINE